MQPSSPVFAGVALACLVACGCGAALSSTDKLGDVAYPFYDAWRWQKVPSLASRVDPSVREDFVKDYVSAHEGVMYADYEVTEISVLEDGLTAHISVVYNWYTQTDTMLVEAQVLETWQRKAKGKPWYWVSQDVIVGSMP